MHPNFARLLQNTCGREVGQGTKRGSGEALIRERTTGRCFAFPTDDDCSAFIGALRGESAAVKDVFLEFRNGAFFERVR